MPTVVADRSGVVDRADYVSDQTVFAPFSNIGYSRRFEVDSGTLMWGDGKLDIAPERLYELATGRQITYDNERRYAPREFRPITQAVPTCRLEFVS